MSNLPNGTVASDIERSAGEIVACDLCGKDFSPDEDEIVCPRCANADDQDD